MSRLFVLLCTCERGGGLCQDCLFFCARVGGEVDYVKTVRSPVHVWEGRWIMSLIDRVFLIEVY